MVKVLSWWKVLAILLMLYTVIGGFLMPVPRLPILHESIRNQHFHVPMWFSMLIILTVSVVNAIKYLKTGNMRYDLIASETAKAGLLMGVLGLISGAIWARFTWGEWWSGDPKQNTTAIGLLIYFALLVLRDSLKDEQQRARIGAIYNIFAFSMLIPLLYIIPKLTDSLHPGSGGNAGFNKLELDFMLRVVFYPAVAGWTLLIWWAVTIRIRLATLRLKLIGF